MHYSALMVYYVVISGVDMQFPSTKTTLLNNLNGNDAAWAEFFHRYQEVIADLGRFKGLTACECDDLVQIVMIRFDRKLANGFKFDPSLAKFRTFFSCLIKGCIYDLLRQRDQRTCAVENLPEMCDGSSPDDLLDMVLIEKWRTIIQDEAMAQLAERVDEKTFQAFDLFALKNRPIPEISALLELAPGSIYTAKSRCLNILQEIIKKLNNEDPELELEL